MNLANFLTDTAGRIPDHPAIRFEGKTITFSQMNRRVDALARGLRRLGLRPGNVCVLMMPSSENWTLVYYALAKLGTLVVPVNFLYRQREIEYIFRDSGARAFVGHTDLGEEVAAAVVLRPGAEVTADELLQYVKERVAPYKYPRVVKFVGELPKTAAGKIFKRGISLKERQRTGFPGPERSVKGRI